MNTSAEILIVFAAILVVPFVFYFIVSWDHRRQSEFCFQKTQNEKCFK